MSQRSEIKTWALRILLKMDGTPLSDSSLDDYIRTGLEPKPTIADISVAKRDLEKDLFISGSTDELTGIVTWTLTTKGEHKAKQLS